MLMNFIRHGDVDIRPVNSIPKRHVTESKTLAYGEVTGHHHSFEESSQVLVYEAIDEDTIQVGNETLQVQKWLEVKQDSVLSHQEHESRVVPKGKYAILQEREYNPFDQEIRRVLD